MSAEKKYYNNLIHLAFFSDILNQKCIRSFSLKQINQRELLTRKKTTFWKKIRFSLSGLVLCICLRRGAIHARFCLFTYLPKSKWILTADISTQIEAPLDDVISVIPLTEASSCPLHILQLNNVTLIVWFVHYGCLFHFDLTKVQGCLE